MKKFPRWVVWSVVSGVLINKPFSDVHECIEHMAGSPIWTHQLPSWLRENEAKLAELFPDLVERPAITHENAEQFFAENRAHLEEMIAVPVIGGASGNPLDGLPDGKETIAIVTP